ncbi:MAG: DUF3352 domain-containing protein [Candidatus Omnitrophota bacterium]
MKKVVLIVLIVLLMAGGVTYFFMKKGGVNLFVSSQFEIENIMPQKPLFYLELRNTKKNIDKILSTSFWKRLSAVDFDVLLKNNLLSKQEAMVYQILKKSLENPKENEIFRKFFSKDVAFAIYEPDFDFSTLSQAGTQGLQLLLDEVFSNLSLVTRLDAQSQIAEFISGSFGQLGDNVTIEDEVYKNQEIKIVSIQGVPYKFVYTRIKDLMIMGVGKFAVQKSIDIFQGAANSLSKDNNYLLAKEKYVANPEMITFFNIETLFLSLEEKLDELPGLEAQAEMKRQMQQTFDSLRGFKSVNISLAWVDLFEMKFDILYDLKRMSESTAKYYSACKNEENQSINFTPSNSLAYSWGNCFDLSYYWEETKKELELSSVPGQPSVTKQIEQYEQMIGLTIDGDILPAFGDEIGGYMKDIHIDRNFPIPELVLFIKVKDQAKVEKLLGLLKNQPAIMFQSESYNGIGLNYINLPVAEYVSPGYCFLNDYLLISVNKELLKNSIDSSKKTTTSLTSNPSFKILNKGLTNKNIGVQFLKIDELAFKMASILEWSNNWVAANDQKKEAFKDGAKLRLTQVQKDIENDERELKQKEQKLTELESTISQMEAEGRDVSDQQIELKEIKAVIQDIKGDLEANVHDAMNMEDTIRAYGAASSDMENRKIYFDHVIIPIVNSFKVIEGMGMYSVISPESMETRVFMKL